MRVFQHLNVIFSCDSQLSWMLSDLETFLHDFLINWLPCNSLWSRLIPSIKVTIFVRTLPPLLVSNIGSVFSFFIISLGQDLWVTWRVQKRILPAMFWLPRKAFDARWGSSQFGQDRWILALFLYCLKRRTRPITSDVAPSLSQERINTLATLREYPSVIRQFSSGDIKQKICLS